MSSILAGSLLVGGAFAAYAVTDNADPFGINVTPGNIDEDTTKYVTLNWGETTNLEGVGLLKVDENRKVGVVSLASTKAYTGVFSLELKDNTANRSNNDYLFNHLEVFIYQGNVDLDERNLPATGLVEKIDKGAVESTPRVKNLQFNADGTASGTEYTIFVHLDSGAASNFAFMSNDVVRITVDWGAKDGEELNATPVYVAKPATTAENNWDDIYVYAWKNEKVNAAYPGVKMVSSYKASDGKDIYELTIPTGMEKVIFNNGKSGDAERKLTAEDIVLSTTGYNPEGENPNVYFNGTAWTSLPGKAEVKTMSATKKGAAIQNLDDYKLAEPGEGNKAAYRFVLEAGDTIGFKDGNTTVHFYHWDEAASKAVDDGTEYSALVAGTYTFYYNENDQMYVSTAKSYYLVGVIGGASKWEDVSRPFVLHDEVNNEYVIENVTLAKGDSIKAMSNSKDYYPAGYDVEYKIDTDEKAGAYDIYFRPDGNGNNDWYMSYLYLAKR